MKITAAFHSHFAHAPTNKHTHKSLVMCKYICTHGRHRLQGKCCGLGEIKPQKREGRQGRGITIKWTNNRDEKAM
jgi:hypothetical protein